MHNNQCMNNLVRNFSQICKQSFPRPQTNSQTSHHSNLLLSGDKTFYIKSMFSRERFSVFILSRYAIADKKAGITWIFLESWSLVPLDNRFWKPLEIFLCIFWGDMLREWNDDSVAEMTSRIENKPWNPAEKLL